MKLRTSTEKRVQSLDDILVADDELGLLADVAPQKSKKTSSNDPAVINFLELIDFVEAHGYEPSVEKAAEKMLAVRLKAYRTRSDLRAKVLKYDTVGLLAQTQEAGDIAPAASVVKVPPLPTQKKVVSLDDIFADDDLELLDDVDSSIFTINHIPVQKEKDIPDEIASRKPCEDFFRYEKLFHDIQQILKTDAVMQARFFREETVIIGSVFILRGMLCYIDSILKEDTSIAERDNPRLRVIFENGTETDLLKRSLIRALYKDPHGKYVDFGLNLFSNASVNITSRDRPTGYIYILSSETDSPALVKLKNAGLLVKIGYSTQEVHERIKNAVNEPTYLEAPVKVKASIACYNLNPQKFERLVHAFLYHQRLTMKLIGKNGKAYRPEEWFTVDWQTALEVCQHIVDGTITQYRMVNTSGKIVQKKI